MKGEESLESINPGGIEIFDVDAASSRNALTAENLHSD